MDEIADGLVLVNGRILTLDPRRPVVAALAVAGGRVTMTGGRAEVAPRRGRHTRVIDLRGATVIPGLVDAHAHLDREGLKAIYPSLARCRSIADIQRLLRGQAAHRKPGEWIVTMPVGAPPFYQGVPDCLAERRWPTRADFDAAAPDHPVYIRGIWGYWNRLPVYSVANSRALALAGVTRDTAPPKGVEIVRDAAGEPTGLFVEHNLIQVLEFTLMRKAPRFTSADRLRALRESQRRYAARGVTAVYEGHGVAPEVLHAYRECHAQGELGLRVNTLVTRCLPEVLDAWEEVARRHPIRDLRWVLVHLARIRGLGAVATTNPISYLYRSAGDEVARLGGAADHLLPHRSLARHRIPFGIATDNKPADPWVAFAAVVARRDMRTGVVVGERERLTRAQALAALTRGGAWVTFTERERGRLAPGWAADLAVLEHDPLTAPFEALVGQTARLTVVGGEIVHHA